ncbi:MAG: hypothetical protein WC838_04585 [Candidatus Margulisiibacteriota bacterium]|jgi:hypothetical protein
MQLIADTNVWYDIGATRRDPYMLKAGGQHRLVATPISILEIASLIDRYNLHERQTAAQAILNYADEIAVDPESHLASLWNLPTPEQNVPWNDICKAIVQSSSTMELQKGVADVNDRVFRKVNVSLAEAWRLYQWNDFKSKVDYVLNLDVPGYKAARRKGKIKHLNKKEGENLSNRLKSIEVNKVIVKGTFCRALRVAGQPCRQPTDAEYARTYPSIAPYVDAYTEYLIRCATEYAPETNDLGDLECFLYLQGHAALVSRDKRWGKIARKVCPAYYYDPDSASI